jgi:predicted nuclease of predicted toxin-antitoxin system
MRFLVDECLHESLVGVTHAAGFEAAHVNHLGLSGKPDWELAERVSADEFTFVTSNRLDFVRLFSWKEWWARQDSNLRPPACEAGALTN